jgi:hypothetical protein
LNQNLGHQEIQTLESTVTSNKLSLLKLASIAMVFRENDIQNKDITIKDMVPRNSNDFHQNQLFRANVI